MAMNDPSASGALHPVVQRIVNAWPLLLTLVTIGAAGIHMEWSVADHERRVAKLEDQSAPLAERLTRIEQQGKDGIERLDRIERRLDYTDQPQQEHRR